jgi:type II secretory ATPase GspE/PulE/Tfp pilus assembly ATPase PilB-like protein
VFLIQIAERSESLGRHGLRSVFRHWPDICQVEDVRGDGERTQEQDARTASTREPAQSSGAGDGGSNAVATCDACREGYHSREEVRKDVSADSDARRIEGENRSSSAANTITYASYFRTLACLCDSPTAHERPFKVRA